MKLGDHTTDALKNGGQLLLKPVMSGKWIYNSQITFANGEGTIGNISTSPEGALENLEGALKNEAA